MSDAPRYEVAYDPKAIKDLKKVDKPIVSRIVRSIDALGTDPRPASSTPLVGDPDVRRLRIGDYRVIYTVRDSELLVLALRVGHRSAVYRER